MTTGEIIDQLLGDIVDPPASPTVTPAVARHQATEAFANFARGLRDLIEAGVVQQTDAADRGWYPLPDSLDQ